MKDISDISLSHSRALEAAQINGEQSDGDKREKNQAVPNPPCPLSQRH